MIHLNIQNVQKNKENSNYIKEIISKNLENN